MTLINCPDCKTEVSDKAEKCLKCGRPIYKPEIEISETAAITGLILTILGSFIMWYTYNYYRDYYYYPFGFIGMLMLATGITCLSGANKEKK